MLEHASHTIVKNLKIGLLIECARKSVHYLINVSVWFIRRCRGRKTFRDTHVNHSYCCWRVKSKRALNGNGNKNLGSKDTIQFNWSLVFFLN